MTVRIDPARQRPSGDRTADDLVDPGARPDDLHSDPSIDPSSDLLSDRPDDRDSRNVILVNLARRSQALVDRQLRLLEEMQRGERDPGRLAHLHQVAQLAARMRRNDESLLVLAGAQTRRRGAGAVPLAALVLAALGEIEQFERVSAEVDSELHLSGHAAADLVHLLTELLDNATAFSAPDTPVRLTARAAADGGAQLLVDDAGIGLGPAALLELNTILRRPPDVDGSSSERMGLVVVGHLAARLGTTVQLDTRDVGTRATVRIPAGLLSDAQLAAPGSATAPTDMGDS